MSPSASPIVLSGSCHPQLAQAIAAELRLELWRREAGKFPDGEIAVRILESVRGKHVVIVQPTSSPAEHYLLELCMLADGCVRGGAERITAVVPYFGYARQDRRTHSGDPIALRLVTDLLRTAKVTRLVGVDVHCATIEAISSVPFEHLTALPLLLNAVRGPRVRHGVVVAPDLGAAKLAQRVARALGVPAAFIHKRRQSGAEVEVSGITGDVKGLLPVIVDDMISTGGTIEAAAKLLLDAGCIPELTVVATHGLFVGPAFDRLSGLPIERIIVTDSVHAVPMSPVRVERVSLAPMLADAISAIHAGKSLDLLLARA